MANISMTFTKSSATTTVESLLWKYGGAIDTDTNYKLVYNTQSDSAHDTIDSRLIDDAWDKMVTEAVGIMRDFSPQLTESTGSKTVVVAMPSRWSGSQATLKKLVDRYIEDGMMADYLNVAAPTEAAVYINRLPQDITDIKVELYTKGAPA